MTRPAPDLALFDPADHEADARAVAEAVVEVKAGKVISHEAVRRWLLSWGTPDELPPPKCGE